MEPPEARPQLAMYSGDRSVDAAFVNLCELEVAHSCSKDIEDPLG